MRESFRSSKSFKGFKGSKGREFLRCAYTNISYIYRVSTVYLPCIYRVSTVINSVRVAF